MKLVDELRGIADAAAESDRHRKAAEHEKREKELAEAKANAARDGQKLFGECREKAREAAGRKARETTVRYGQVCWSFALRDMGGFDDRQTYEPAIAIAIGLLRDEGVAATFKRCTEPDLSHNEGEGLHDDSWFDIKLTW